MIVILIVNFLYYLIDCDQEMNFLMVVGPKIVRK